MSYGPGIFGRSWDLICAGQCGSPVRLVAPCCTDLGPFRRVLFPRDVLGEAAYESLARKGEKITTAEMVTYAHDQIDQARAELNAVSK
jgi:hypothetical protein